MFAKMSKRAMGWLRNHVPCVFTSLWSSKRGESIVAAVIGIGVSMMVMAVVFPIAMTQITAANTTGWETAVTTIFGVLLPILAVIGIALKYIPRGGKK